MIKNQLYIYMGIICPASIQAQETPKKCTAIKVQGISFRQVQLALLDGAYMIDKKDDELGTVYTLPTANKNGTSYILYVRVKDSTAMITGKWNMPGAVVDNNPLVATLGTYQSITKIGGKGNLNYDPWNGMNNFAISLHGKIEYQKP